MTVDALASFLRRWRRYWWVLGVAVGIALIGISLLQKELAIDRLYALEGGAYTQPGWLRKSLPPISKITFDERSSGPSPDRS